VLFEEKSTKHPVLQWALQWRSADAAQEAFKLYLQAIEGKSHDVRWKKRDDKEASGSNQFGGFHVTLDGWRMDGVEGLP
jgi:hypothetical protein